MCSIGWPGAVRCRVIPAPCSVMLGARCAAWRMRGTTTASSFADARSRRTPPPLLPAPGAPCFSTAPKMGPLRRIIAQLSPLAASKRMLSALAKEERAAAKREEQRETLAEMVCPPPRTLLFPRHYPIRSESRGAVYVACTLAEWRSTVHGELPHHIRLIT